MATVRRGALYTLVILALAILLAIAAFVVGQQHRLPPPPVGLAANGLWTVINLRIENRLLERFDELKEWADKRFVRKPEVAEVGGFSALSQQIRAKT